MKRKKTNIETVAKTTSRKCGRPTKKTPSLEKELLESISDGLPLSHAAAIAGINYETFCAWRRENSEFSDTISTAIAKGVATRLLAIRKAADGGDVASAKWWLEHVFPEHFARNRIDLQHNISGGIHHDLSVNPETLEAIAASRKRYESRTNN